MSTSRNDGEALKHSQWLAHQKRQKEILHQEIAKAIMSFEDCTGLRVCRVFLHDNLGTGRGISVDAQL